MRRDTVLLMLLAVLVGCATGIGQRDGDPHPVLAIVGASVLPMTDPHTVLEDHTIIVSQQRIVWVGPSDRARIPRGAEIVDGRGRFVVPGLIDMHAHLEYVEDADVLKLFVAHGVTSVRSMDGRAYILSWRARVRSGELLGPDIITAGPIIDGAPPLRDDNLSVADAAAAREAVMRQHGEGYDFIKLYTNLSPQSFDAAATEARERGLLVTGHIPRGLDLTAVIPHYWTLEHLSELDGEVLDSSVRRPFWARLLLAGSLDDERTARAADAISRAGVVLVPTLVERERSIGTGEQVSAWSSEPAMRDLPPDMLERWRSYASRIGARLDDEDWALVEEGRRNRLQLVRALHDRGVRLAVGTDTPNAWVAPGAAVHQEMAILVDAGLTPGEALRAATATPGAALSSWERRGVIVEGARADLLLLEANPMADIGAAQARAGVVLAGRWFDEASLAAMRQDLVRAQ